MTSPEQHDSLDQLPEARLLVPDDLLERRAAAAGTRVRTVVGGLDDPPPH